MADEIQLDYPTGSTLYAQVRNTSGEVWNGTGFEVLVAANWLSYAIPMTETTGTGVYLADLPGVIAGLYAIAVRKQATGTPLVSDLTVGSGEIDTRSGSGGGGSTAPDITTGIAPALNGLATVYCSDENIALRAWGDYMAVCPPSQKLAAGSDGVILSADRWTLTSATVDFEAAGIVPGHVVWLRVGNTFGSQGEIFAVNAVDGDAVTLRRLGQTASVGQPPAPAAGLTGVQFSVLTFGPQIDVASYDANHFFGIDPNSATKYPGRMYDQRELQSYVVLMVLKRAYGISLKQKAEDYALKLAEVSDELNDLTARLTIRWGSDGKSEPPTSIFSTRVRR